MHATKLITPELMLVMAFGLLVFILVYRWIFRKEK
jgi:hypothetical protein